MERVVDEFETVARLVGERLVARGWQVSTAESCTGGWVSQVLTSVAGSSGWFERGFVTYSNAAKRELLGVAAATLDAHGAVSEAVALEMARGALAHSRADLAVAVTGIAGPGGASADKPVGTVCFGWALRAHSSRACTEHFTGERAAVRRQAVARALDGVVETIERAWS